MNLFPPPVLSYETPSGLMPIPKLGVEDRPIHWLGDDGRNVFIEIQGQLAAVAIRKGPLKFERAKRGDVQGFSNASRLRMLKTMNRLDFSRAGKTTFATQTWRDECGRPSPLKITQARSVCQRDLERLAGRRLPAIWRVEWQVRKRGRLKGEYMPHVHVVYFGIPFIPKEDWTMAWARAIGFDGRVSVKLEGVENARKLCYYVSKYMAKPEWLSNLDIPSYLNKYLPGRKWGIYRRELMPWADKLDVRTAPGALIDRIREIATEQWAKCPESEESGFCVFGPAARKIQELVDSWLLTQPSESLH